jgi:hypothetical protein
MDFLIIALVILVVVGTALFVYKYAFEDGVYFGKGQGRLEILKENLHRQAIMEKDLAREKAIVSGLLTDTDLSNSKFKQIN